MRQVVALAAEGPIVFVHIPKTAGTSLRRSALEFFGKDAVAFDYGPGSDWTSDCFRKHLYDAFEPEALADALRSKAFVCGHVCATKLLPLLPRSPLVTFVRDPIARIESEFQHFRTRAGYEKPFAAFVADPPFRSKQRFYTRPLEPYHFAFVGRTERYDEELVRFNTMFGTTIAPRRANVREEAVHEPIDPAMLVRLLALNGPDVVFTCFADRVNELALDGEVPPRPAGFGAYLRHPSGGIHGFAFALESNEPVEVGLYGGGERIATTLAIVPRAELVAFHVRMTDSVGFEFKPPVVAQAAAKGRLELRIESPNLPIAERIGSDFFF